MVIYKLWIIPIIIILYLKPLYFIISFLLFFIEYIYFIHFLFEIYNNFNDYYKLEIKEIDISVTNCLMLWNEYCKILAYKKVYSLFMKKKVGFHNVIVMLIIFTFTIPLKFLKLCYYFIIKNNNNFRTGLEFLFFDNYKLVKNLKIEVLNRKIYLNCYTIGKLCRELFKNNSLITKENFVKGVCALKNQAELIERFENSGDKVRVDLISGIDCKNKKIFSPHFGYYENNKTIHSTSNIKFAIRNDQINDVPMPSLIKPNSPNPGTVISLKVDKIVKIDRYKLISRYELDAIIYNYQEEFNLTNDRRNYILSKDDVFRDILSNYFKIDKVDKTFMKELVSNNYTYILINGDERYFENGYDEFYNE